MTNRWPLQAPRPPKGRLPWVHSLFRRALPIRTALEPGVSETAPATQVVDTTLSNQEATSPAVAGADVGSRAG